MVSIFRQIVWRRIFFSIAVVVFAFNEASIFSWMEFITNNQTTAHAAHGLRLASWWSSFSLGAMVGLTFSEIPRENGGLLRVRLPEALVLMACLLYLCLFRPAPWLP
ncbi:MAG: hypothetical protein LCH73_08875 [Proteobacteria bacterium]|nr:hypothetical protein [Pseudomonadota bacterium]